MACSGAHCTSHNTGTTTCVGHRSSCSTNRTLTGLSINTGTNIVADQIEHLRSQIRNELSRWNQHSTHNFTLREGTGYTAAYTITDDHVENLMQMVSDVDGSSGHSDKNLQTIQDTDWDNVTQSVVAKYNIIRKNCICNSDCSCNAVCSCHNNCDCNY